MPSIQFVVKSASLRMLNSDGKTVYDYELDEDPKKKKGLREIVVYSLERQNGHGMLELSEDDLGGRSFQIGDRIAIEVGAKGVARKGVM